MRTWSTTLLKFLWGVYLILTSLYCMLTFLSYTYNALIKAPPYEWLRWFVRHHAELYWLTLLAAAVAYWQKRRSWRYLLLFASLVAMGVYITVHALLPTLESTWAAYGWSLVFLLPLALLSAADVLELWPRTEREETDGLLFVYSSAVMVAIAIALLSAMGTRIHTYLDTKSLTFRFGDFELTLWSVLSHVLVALLVLSIINLIRVATRKTKRPRSLRLMLSGALIAIVLWSLLSRFLENGLSFYGWPSYIYAAVLTTALTLFGLSFTLPLMASRAVSAQGGSPKRKILLLAATAGLVMAAVMAPTVIGREDWNGLLQHAFTLVLWVVLTLCVYSLRPRRHRQYSIAAVLGVVLLAGFAYGAARASVIVWAKPLGSTDEDILASMEKYAAGDVSFDLAHHILGNARVDPCGSLCRILRQNTNIRTATIPRDVNLVADLKKTGSAPNIFIFVIDSLRPDYLGAYNPRVDFTPNLDAFARDSVVLQNVYTQYAGTSLSEPAIWSGVMLLHAHYAEPFAKVNNLERLARTDGYQMIVSYDTVMSQILSPSDDMIKVDEGKLWNRYEICSTLDQTENVLDARRDKTRPVLFYAQPMNVHQFGTNDLPRMNDENWRIRPHLNNRIAYELHQVDECLGKFFSYLKARGMYDDSIIVLTADHGDATGEFGRHSHAVLIYPEVMHVPLVIHLPKGMRRKVVYDDHHLLTLTDITPSLYYLLDHRPIVSNPLFGHPIFTETKAELEGYARNELFLASDLLPIYGILGNNGSFLYMVYASPPKSLFFDLARDPGAERNVVTEALKAQYDKRVIEYLRTISDFYEYKPGLSTWASLGQ